MKPVCYTFANKHLFWSLSISLFVLTLMCENVEMHAVGVIHICCLSALYFCCKCDVLYIGIYGVRTTMLCATVSLQ